MSVRQLTEERPLPPPRQAADVPVSEPGDIARRVRAFLLLAIAASMAWLAWQQPGSWRDGLVAASAVALGVRAPWWRHRRSVRFAGRALARPARLLGRRIGVLRRARRLWHKLPASGRATVPLLALLNVVITLALVDTARLASGLWASHPVIDFTLLFAMNITVLRLAGGAPLPANAPSAPNVLPVPYQLDGHASDGLRPNGHPDKIRQDGAALKVAATGADPGPKPRRFRRPRPGLSTQRGLPAVVTALAAAWLGYAHPGLPLILAVLVVGFAILSTMNVSRSQAMTMLLAVALGVATVDYVTWRFSVTNWHGWWIAVPLLVAEALGAIHVLGFQVTVWPRPPATIGPTEDPARYPIFILVPTLNEGASILRPTLEGCIAARKRYLARYPDGQVTIVVCNDGRAAAVPCWAVVDSLARELGVRCVTRAVAGGAKAGNIEHARRELQITGNAFLAIFDADQVPKPDFLLNTIPPFADSKVGWVQTGQYYANLDNPVSRWADDQQSMFYNLLCPGKASLNAAFICGTNVVIRAAALDEIGGLPQDSVTEDFAASVVLHRRWRSVYLSDVLATGLGPLDIPSYLKQQGRWALGTLGVFRRHWRDILLPRRNGLRMGQRLQYFLACTHYLCGLRDFIYMLSPVLFILTGVPAVRTATLDDYLLHFAPYALLGITGIWYAARGVTGLRGIVIGYGSSPALISSLAAVILGRRRPFAVTSKEHRDRRSVRYLGLYVCALLLCIAALGWATQVRGRQQTSMFISILWVVYSLLMLGSFLWLAGKDISVHRAAARSGSAELTARHPYRSRLLARRTSLAPVVNLGVAALVAAPLLLGGRLAALPLFPPPRAPSFVISGGQLDAQYAGVSLPARLLNGQPALQRQLGVRFSIVGRTQDLTDTFDQAWADKLAAQGARPWITLEFGNMGLGRKAPLSASLPAIINGVDDVQIARWAAEIRDFAQPVYLTVLLHVDKNWAVSSGVANGGIPEDVPKAWTHIESIFRAAGADNVAWVWAPAVPVNDQRFAPPRSTIDVVLQSFINYPGTPWGDPGTVLRNLVRRYPGKPLFLEVSASGASSAKARWLAEFGLAVEHCPQVYAVLYHEGGPQLKPTPAQAASWSFASDPASLAAWRGIVTGLSGARRLR